MRSTVRTSSGRAVLFTGNILTFSVVSPVESVSITTGEQIYVIPLSIEAKPIVDPGDASHRYEIVFDLLGDTGVCIAHRVRRLWAEQCHPEQAPRDLSTDHR